MQTTISPYRFVTSPPGNPCINDVAVDGDCLVVAADDGRIRVVDLAGDPFIRENFTPAGHRVLANAIDVLGDLVVVGNHHGELLRLRLGADGLQPLGRTVLGDGPINTVSIGADGDYVVVGCYEGSVDVVGPAGEVVARCDLGRGAVKSLDLASDDTAVVGTAGGALGCVELRSGRIDWLPAHDAIVNDLALDAERRVVASVGRDFTVRWTDVSTSELIACVDLARRSPKAVVQVGPDIAHVADYWGWITAVRCGGEVIASRRIATAGVSCLAASAYGVIAGSYDGSLVILDPVSLHVRSHTSLAREHPIASAGEAGA